MQSSSLTFLGNVGPETGNYDFVLVNYNLTTLSDRTMWRFRGPLQRLQRGHGCLREYQVLRAPALSPTCNKMRVLSWNAKAVPGAHLDAYSLICTVEAFNLTAEQSAGGGKGSSTMEIELTDELHVCEIMVAAGTEVDVGAVLAILDEDEALGAGQPVEDAEGDCLWQAYVKNKNQDGTCGTC